MLLLVEFAHITIPLKLPTTKTNIVSAIIIKHVLNFALNLFIAITSAMTVNNIITMLLITFTSF
jgi:hypothetical protein